MYHTIIKSCWDCDVMILLTMNQSAAALLMANSSNNFNPKHHPNSKSNINANANQYNNKYERLYEQLGTPTILYRHHQSYKVPLTTIVAPTIAPLIIDKRVWILSRPR